MARSMLTTLQLGNPVDFTLNLSCQPRHIARATVMWSQWVRLWVMRQNMTATVTEETTATSCSVQLLNLGQLTCADLTEG